jgi:hypothetical protein
LLALLFFQQFAPSSALILGSGQSTLIGALDPNIEIAFSQGVIDNTFTQIVPPIPSYSLVPIANHPLVRDPFDDEWASFISTSNINEAFPVVKFTGTITLEKLTGLGTNGSITYVGGYATAVVNPT